MIYRTLALLSILFTSAAALAQQPAAGELTVDKEKKTVTIDCKIAPRKLDYLNEIYPIEVIACWPHPKGKKAHETIVTFNVAPSEVHKALESLGLKPGTPAKGESEPAKGPELDIFIELPGADGAPRRERIERALVDKKTLKPMPKVKWFFTGSTMTQPNPDKPDKVYGADVTGTLICVFPVTDQVVIQSDLSMKDEPLLKMETNKRLLPAEGSPVKLILQAR